MSKTSKGSNSGGGAGQKNNNSNNPSGNEKQKKGFVKQDYSTKRNRFKKIKNTKNPANTYKFAKAEYDRLRSEKKAAKERRQQRQAEIEAAMNVYKEKKKLKNKKLSAKTAKGQPIMKNRIELLLDQIQNTVKS
ncbi:uncharacterized protein LOC135845995 [Planococcus citri]|uniref:uncharacterized protein LOC135845995 n=1 Tax=Planococcus citri TaxID=170843 RepID=UPI0031F9E785